MERYLRWFVLETALATEVDRLMRVISDRSRTCISSIILCRKGVKAISPFFGDCNFYGIMQSVEGRSFFGKTSSWDWMISFPRCWAQGYRMFLGLCSLKSSKFRAD
jgi:hypothetical protein